MRRGVWPRAAPASQTVDALGDRRRHDRSEASPGRRRVELCNCDPIATPEFLDDPPAARPTRRWTDPRRRRYRHHALCRRGIPRRVVRRAQSSRPELVLDTHRAYLDAGADLLETNSFGANRFKLEAFGLADRVHEINKKAVRLAREAREITGRPVLVAGSIGPTGRTLAPFGVVSEVVRAVFREQIEALLEEASTSSCWRRSAAWMR